MLRDEIKSVMRDLRSAADGTVRATFTFPAGFTGFRGHFPGNPVLPGVCIVQAALVMAETVAERTLRLDEIVSAKFLAVVSAGQDLIFTCREQGADGDQRIIKASAVCGERKVAELSLRITYGAGFGP